MNKKRLGLLLEQNFPTYNKVCASIEHNPSGQQSDNFSYTHEFAILFSKRKKE